MALCQLHVTADKEQNLRTARKAIEVRTWMYCMRPCGIRDTPDRKYGN